MSAGVQVPERFARSGIESQQIAGIIGAEEEMPGRGKNPCDAFAVSDFVIPHDFASTVVKRAKCRIGPEVAVAASPPFSLPRGCAVIDAKDSARIHVEQPGLRIKAGRHPIRGSV